MKQKKDNSTEKIEKNSLLFSKLLDTNTAPGIAISKSKYKRAGHLTDQMLKYNYPKDNQPSIFDSLQDETKKDIEISGIEIKEIVEGIKLTPSETKIIDCLCKLLHKKNRTFDYENRNISGFSSENQNYEIIKYGNQNAIAPKLFFTLYELTKEYKGGEKIGGKDVENVRQVLTTLGNKQFLLSYIETTFKKDGGRIEKKIEEFRKLFGILKISQAEYDKEDVELYKKEETILMLSPIFIRQIDSKFILYPEDITKRTIIAYGSHNISETTIKLRDYLMRELSSKRFNPEIALERLYYLLSEKWMKEGRRKKVKEYTDKALETMLKLDILISYEIVPNATGEQKIIFKLNPEWE
jgi:hypothetical protein